MLNGSTKIEQYARGITVLQGKAKLYAHKAKAHVPYLPKTKFGFCTTHNYSCVEGYVYAQPVVFREPQYDRLSRFLLISPLLNIPKVSIQ